MPSVLTGIALYLKGKGGPMPKPNERVNRLANALVKLGVEKGDRIGILQVNCNQYIETYYAAAKIGCHLCPSEF